MALKSVPIEYTAAIEWLAATHRHLPKITRDKYRVAVADALGLVGVAHVARPKARALDSGCEIPTLEVIRVAVIEDPERAKNAVSFLLSRAAKIAQLMGYTRIITYILPHESGASLTAAGWTRDLTQPTPNKKRNWNTKARPREDSAHQEAKQRWVRHLAQ